MLQRILLKILKNGKSIKELKLFTDIISSTNLPKDQISDVVNDAIKMSLIESSIETISIKGDNASLVQLPQGTTYKITPKGEEYVEDIR